MQEKNDAQNEDEPRCCKALQGDGSGKNSLFKVECKPYPDQKDIQKEADTSKVRCYRQEQQGYGETINTVSVGTSSVSCYSVARLVTFSVSWLPKGAAIADSPRTNNGTGRRLHASQKRG